MTPPPTPESIAELRKLAEASLAERESGSSSRVRRLDFIHTVGEERSILALLDALEAAQKREADFHMDYRIRCDEETKNLHVERDRLAAELDGERLEIEKLEAQRATLLDDREVERQRVRDLTAECERLKAAVAEAVGLLRETARRIRNIAEFYPDVEGLPEGDPDAVDMAWQVLASSLTSADAFLAKHQRPPEGGV